MKVKDMDFKKGAEFLKQCLGDNPERVTIYTVNENVSRSGMSATIKAFIITNNYRREYVPLCIAYGRVHGCGLDRGFEAAYNIFMYAYPNLRYQDILEHHWL